MDALLIGTGGDSGWPQDGCTCASCLRAAAAGIHRAPGRVIVDGELSLTQETPPRSSNGGSAHRVLEVPGGWDITGPDGSRLLAAAGPGAIPEPPDGTTQFDIALLDLLASPAQLGLLRARGLVTEQTRVAALYTDHRISSAQEMTRRCALWRAAAGQDGQVIATGEPTSASDATRPSRPHRTLILGGARSGKSREAELSLSGEPSVTYVAAGPWADDQWEGGPDAEWESRVAAHRATRPAWWRTEESLDLAGALRQQTGALLIDGIGTWLAAVMDQAGAWPDDAADWAPQAATPDPQHLVSAKIDELIDAWRQTRALVVAVTDEVGSGLVPAYPAGRIFRDQLGWLNQRLAAESDVNVLVVAGRPVILPT